jgi:AcrR family transcriptional regulator
MLPAGSPKFRRRKAERPDEIVVAALEVFVEKGFAAARLEDIAALAGVSKGAIYLYFATKEDIFRAVVEQSLAPSLQAVKNVAADGQSPFPELLKNFTAAVASLLDREPVGGIIKVVIGESRNFPELARAWHDTVVAPALGAMTAAITAAQARGELRSGDARRYAISLVAPLLVGVIWRETFVPIGAAPLDIPALAEQHVELWLRGMRAEPAA